MTNSERTTTSSALCHVVLLLFGLLSQHLHAACPPPPSPTSPLYLPSLCPIPAPPSSSQTPPPTYLPLPMLHTSSFTTPLTYTLLSYPLTYPSTYPSPLSYPLHRTPPPSLIRMLAKLPYDPVCPSVSRLVCHNAPRARIFTSMLLSEHFYILVSVFFILLVFSVHFLSIYKIQENQKKPKESNGVLGRSEL